MDVFLTNPEIVFYYGFWGQIIGAVIGGVSSAFGASKQNQAQTQQAREQMAFQERMSNTSYQRGIADMRAAGLNPMLAYAQGGASSPGGTQASIVNPMGQAPEIIANSAAKVTALNLEKKRTDAEVALKREQTKGEKARSEREVQWTDTLRNNTELQMLMQSGSLPNTAFGMASWLARKEHKRVTGQTTRSHFQAKPPPSERMRGKKYRLKQKYVKKPYAYTTRPSSRPGFKYASSYKRTVRGPF